VLYRRAQDHARRERGPVSLRAFSVIAILILILILVVVVIVLPLLLELHVHTAYHLTIAYTTI
jgi:hypothetical protein